MRSTPERIAVPADAGEVAATVKSAVRDGLRVKAIGSGHSFSEIAAADGVQVRLDRLDRLVDVDAASGLATVGPGSRCTGSPRCSTSTAWPWRTSATSTGRPSPARRPPERTAPAAGSASIATQIRGLELVLADGSVVTTSPTSDPSCWTLARVGLGALGVITTITLQCVPRFALHVVDEPMPLDRVLDEIDDLVEDNDHFEFFWFPLHRHRTDPPVPSGSPATRS